MQDVLKVIHKSLTHIRALALSGDSARVADLADAAELPLLEFSQGAPISQVSRTLNGCFSAYVSKHGALPFSWKIDDNGTLVY